MFKGIVFVSIAVLLWAIALVLSKIGLDYSDVNELFFIQLSSATVCAWSFLFISRTKFSLSKQHIIAYSTGFFEPFLAYSLTLFGLKEISTSSASIIFSFESILIIILSSLFFQRKLNIKPHIVFFMLLSLLGAYLVISPTLDDSTVNNQSLLGLILVFLGVLSAALYVVISANLISKITPLALITGQLSFSMILILFFLTPSKHIFEIALTDWLLIALSGVLQYFLAFLFYLSSLKFLKLHIAGNMLYFIPIATMFLSYILLKENIIFLQIIGVLLTICSVYLINRFYENA